jgi:hypoxanthine phosphoribosyltransferase
MEILYSAETVDQRIRELGKEISSVYQGKSLTLLVIMNGGLFFGAKLAEEISVEDFFIDSVSAASYSHHNSTGTVTLRSRMKLDVKGRHILILDEVLDTGRTLKEIILHLENLGAESVRTVVLAEKTIPRPDGIEHADWSGFLVDDRYLIGCGMDSDEKFRNLPFIGYL